MEGLYNKIQEYVKMDTEISAEEFLSYYKDVMDMLAADFEQLTEEGLFQAKIITSILSANAETRGKRRTAETKKFRKIHEKSKFWADAITYRLKKSGLSEDAIKERTAAMEKEMQ